MEYVSVWRGGELPSFFCFLFDELGDIPFIRVNSNSFLEGAKQALSERFEFFRIFREKGGLKVIEECGVYRHNRAG